MTETASISTSYNSGQVQAPTATNNGAIIGIDSFAALTITNVYWDSTINNGSGNTSNSFFGSKINGGTINAIASTGSAATSAFLSGLSGITSSLCAGSAWYQVTGETRPILQIEYSPTIYSTNQLELMNLNLSGSYTLGTNVDAAFTNPTPSVGSNNSQIWAGTASTAMGFVPIGNSTTPFLGSLNGENYIPSAIWQ